MRKDGSKVSGMQRVDQYPIASAFINKMMECVIECVKADPILKHKLFQANFQDALSEEAVVSIALACSKFYWGVEGLAHVAFN